MSIKDLNPLLNSIKFESKKFVNIKKFLEINFKDIQKNWPKALPKGIIHGDLFIDNIFFKKNKLLGIIDFYFAANDFFMYEIAICVNALCFEKINSTTIMVLSPYFLLYLKLEFLENVLQLERLVWFYSR